LSKLIDIRKSFFKNYEETFLLPNCGRIRSNLIRLKNEDFSLHEIDLLAFEELCRSGSIEDIYFVFHLLNIIEMLPNHFLRLLLIQGKPYPDLYNNLLLNLNRIFSFPIVNEEILKLYKDSKNSYIEKFYILKLIYCNSYAGHLRYKKGKIVDITIYDYLWNGLKFIKKNKNLEREIKESFKIILQDTILKRYKYILSDYVHESWPTEISNLMGLFFPVSIEHVSEELIPLYEKALDLRNKENNKET